MSERVAIGDAIIAGIGSSDVAIEQMQEIVDRLGAAGFVIVPRDATQEMLDSVTAADQHEPWSDKTMRGVYVEMINAALAS